MYVHATMIQKWNIQWKKLCCLYCLSELAVLKLIFYLYNSVSDLRFSLLVELCNSKQVCCRKTIETTQFFSISVSLLYHSELVVLKDPTKMIPKIPFTSSFSFWSHQWSHGRRSQKNLWGWEGQSHCPRVNCCEGVFEITFFRPVIGQLSPIRSFHWFCMILKNIMLCSNHKNT